MNAKELTLNVLQEPMGVCRLAAAEPVPAWSGQGDFFSVTRTTDEVSIVCAERYIPETIVCERGWRMMKIQGVLDFGLVGVVAGISAVLAAAQLGIFVISTYNTDYILVKQTGQIAATAALRQAGYKVFDEPSEIVQGSDDDVQFQE